jgi:hypothetical protein
VSGWENANQFRRSDGAILWLRSKLIVRLELPAAHEYEAKLKAEKEQNGANGMSDIEHVHDRESRG